MPQSEPITILLISEQAEIVKTLTLNLRGLFPGCHIEVVYSADEARTWPSAREWTLICIDDACLAGALTAWRAQGPRPYASIMLHSDRIESPSPRHADIDFFSRNNRLSFLQNSSTASRTPSKPAI